VNYSDPFGLCPIEVDGIPCTFTWGVGGLVAGAAGGALVGGTVGSVVPVAGTLAGAGSGALTGGFFGLTGGALIGLARDVGSGLAILYNEASSEGSVKGSKSAEEYDAHVGKLGEARGRLGDLEGALAGANGPKAQAPIRDQIKRLKGQINGHEKEIRQKWPDGRPQ
jgi:hypothetical protein